MVCIYCGAKTEVINSRLQRRNNNVWRRRKCPKCQALFTTHEVIHLASSVSVASTDQKIEPFTPAKLFSEILNSLQDVLSPYTAAQELADTITHKLIKNVSKGPIKAQTISQETAAVLKRFNRQAYLRYIANHPSVQPKR